MTNLDIPLGWLLVKENKKNLPIQMLCRAWNIHGKDSDYRIFRDAFVAWIKILLRGTRGYYEYCQQIKIMLRPKYFMPNKGHEF